MTLEFLTNILSVPNPSGHEELLAECIENWCHVSGVTVKKDGKGNMFLTKGGANKFYPCYTAHLDSVHDDQKDYAVRRMLMTPKVEGDKITMWIKNDKGEEIQTGTGSDCKNGVAIALAAISRLPSAKCALYVGEEKGCTGSSGSDFSFFDDCAFVVGLDSPDRNRAAKTCCGLHLFSEKFFEEHLGPICRKHGLTDFRHEGGTDIMFIRGEAKVDKNNPDMRIETVNFGNGGYDLHSSREWCSYKDTCEAEELAVALAKEIPLDRMYVSVPGRLPPPPRPAFAPPPFWGPAARSSSRRPIQFGRNHGPDEMCSCQVSFSDMDNFTAFIKDLDHRDLPVQIDDDFAPDMVVIIGQLRYVKPAFVCAFNAEEHTKYSNYNEFKEMEGEDDFYLGAEFGNDNGTAQYRKTAKDSVEDAEFTMRDPKTPTPVDKSKELPPLPEMTAEEKKADIDAFNSWLGM